MLLLLLLSPAAAQQAPGGDGQAPPWAQTPQGQQEMAAAAHRSRELSDALTDVMAFMRHGSPRSVASATMHVASMAATATLPATFRRECVRTGVVEQLVQMLKRAALGKQQGELKDFSPPTLVDEVEAALIALANIATDDPTTDADNDNARAVCAAGAVPPTARLLLSGEEATQQAAAALVATLAECATLGGSNPGLPKDAWSAPHVTHRGRSPQCQKMCFGHGVLEPLLQVPTRPTPTPWTSISCLRLPYTHCRLGLTL